MEALDREHHPDPVDVFEDELARLDKVAYIRFASVYQRFDDIQAFTQLIERLERENPGEVDRRQISLLDKGAARRSRKP